MKKVLGIGGSPRKGGNSDILLKQVLKGAREESVVTEVIQLRDYQFQGCIGCGRCRKDKQCTGLQDGMQLIYPKIRESRGLVLISPIYSYNMTALMKSFIERLCCFYDFGNERPGYWSSRLAGQDRKAIIAVVGIGEEGVGVDVGGIEVERAVIVQVRRPRAPFDVAVTDRQHRWVPRTRQADLRGGRCVIAPENCVYDRW